MTINRALEVTCNLCSACWTVTVREQVNDEQLTGS